MGQTRSAAMRAVRFILGALFALAAVALVYWGTDIIRQLFDGGERALAAWEYWAIGIVFLTLGVAADAAAVVNLRAARRPPTLRARRRTRWRPSTAHAGLVALWARCREYARGADAGHPRPAPSRAA